MNTRQTVTTIQTVIMTSKGDELQMWRGAALPHNISYIYNSVWWGSDDCTLSID